MDAERAPWHLTDSIETKSRGRFVLVSIRSQNVMCEAYGTTMARRSKESFFVVTSKHMVYKCQTYGWS
jgi:hypothetical protein